MEHTSSATALAVGTGLSANVDPVLAAEQVCEQVSQSIPPGQVDLLFLFVSGGHVRDAEAIAGAIGERLGPGTLIGVTGEGVIGGEREIERQPAVSVFAASLPGTSIQPFAYRDLPHVREEDADSLHQLAQAIGARRDMRATFFFADPFSVPAAAAVDAMARVHQTVDGLKRSPVIGGLASGATRPGGNVLIINDRAMRTGGVGLTLRGDVEVDTIVSQGCRPIGRPLLVTGAQRNVIKTLGGRRAMDVLREIVTELDPADRELLPQGVFLGRVIDEYKGRFGRGDFLIRGVLRVDQQSGAIAVGDLVRVGQTIQFHLRDAKTASEDLGLLLAAQQLQHPAAGGLLITCNGRGTRLFGEANHDAEAVTRALVNDQGAPLPLSGFFAAGEIGPIGGMSFLHGHTASLALFRPRRRGATD